MVSKTRAMETRMLTGRRPAMALTHVAGKTCFVFDILRIVLMHQRRHNEFMGLAMSRPAMKRTHCVAMLDKNNEIVC